MVLIAKCSISWVYSRTIGFDGCFKLQHKVKPSDGKDMVLTDGRGCFVGQDNYQHYLSAAVEVKEVRTAS
jgi:hypothetical protein